MAFYKRKVNLWGFCLCYMLRHFIGKIFCHVDISPLCMPLVANQVFILDFQWKAFKEFLPISMGKLKTLYSRCSVFLNLNNYFLNSSIIQKAKTNKILFCGGCCYQIKYSSVFTVTVSRRTIQKPVYRRPPSLRKKSEGDVLLPDISWGEHFHVVFCCSLFAGYPSCSTLGVILD